ncbi:MAG: D-alanyl-D-alanine carboxypeptidase [Lachnospiraceae bacterium]|nr:D-alanyl-D-alanine carboxypeptidase [Lachnospiraceae bacterium]
MKKILCLALMFCVLFTGCKKESSIFMAYQAEDSAVNTDIGSYIEAEVGDFKSKTLAVVTEEENNMANEMASAIATMQVNNDTGEVLFANNVYDKIYPASTTKILTALVTLKYGNLADEVTFKEDNAGITTPGAKLCNYRAGDVVTIETLLGSLLVYSGNDAAVAIAEHISGSVEAFVDLMNEEAARLGATSTHFTNPHGLHDENHYTTAYDMYLIFRECIKYDKFREIVKMTSYRSEFKNANGEDRYYRFETTNLFLLGTRETPEGVTVYGGKTGSTGSAGDCLIIYSEREDGTGFVTAVFKASSKEDLYDQMTYLLSLE